MKYLPVPNETPEDAYNRGIRIGLSNPKMKRVVWSEPYKPDGWSVARLGNFGIRANLDGRWDLFEWESELTISSGEMRGMLSAQQSAERALYRVVLDCLETKP